MRGPPTGGRSPDAAPATSDPSLGWHHPDVPAQQAALTADEFVRWLGGTTVHHPFAAFAWALALTRPRTLLDVGCGVGHYVAVARATGHAPVGYLGCDSSEAMIRFARAHEPTAEFLVADQRDLRPYGDASVDLVVNGCALIHLDSLGGWGLAIRAAARVSRRWVYLHKVPILRTQAVGGADVQTTTHRAYGVDLQETAVMRPLLDQIVAERGLAPVGEVGWNLDQGISYLSLLCEKKERAA